MKKTIAVILAILISYSPLYAGHKKKAKKKKKHTVENNIISISMHRTACYGHCPDYTVDVNKNGTVRYVGIRFTKDSGAFEKNVGIGKVNGLLAKFASYRLDTCPDIYTNRIPDLPGIIYTIQYKDKTKTIRNAGFGPDFLKELSSDVDAAAQVDNTWKKIEMPKK